MSSVLSVDDSPKEKNKKKKTNKKQKKDLVAEGGEP